MSYTRISPHKWFDKLRCSSASMKSLFTFQPNSAFIALAHVPKPAAHLRNLVEVEGQANQTQPLSIHNLLRKYWTGDACRGNEAPSSSDERQLEDTLQLQQQ